MSTPCAQRDSMQGHPCFGGDHRKNGRIHLPVAPACNIKCNFCSRRHDCANESRPGVTSRLLTPAQALDRVREIAGHPTLGSLIKVVGIAGPGDPLANEATFETFRLVHEEFPDRILCLSTNGLELPNALDRLLDLGVRSLTVTINAYNTRTAAQIYGWVFYQGRRLTGEAGAAVLMRNQLIGLERAAKAGLVVKVNTVLVPGINDGDVERIAREVKRRGATIMNVMPLIPQAEFAHLTPPTPQRMEEVREANERIIGQFRHCRQCRADAIGLIGEDNPASSWKPVQIN